MTHGKEVSRTPDNEFNDAKLGGAAHLLGGIAGVKSTILHFFLILSFFISTKVFFKNIKRKCMHLSSPHFSVAQRIAETEDKNCAQMCHKLDGDSNSFRQPFQITRL